MARFDNHSNIEHLISEPRLRSYREVFEHQSDEELYGAYEWNKAVVACFAPLNQIVEVTLRNAIHNALSDRFVGHWYRRPTYSSFAPKEQGQPRAREPHAVYNLKNNFKKAHDKAYEELQRKGIGGTPTVGQVIAKTDFSTWEYALDTEFYDGSGTVVVN